MAYKFLPSSPNQPSSEEAARHAANEAELEAAKILSDQAKLRVERCLVDLSRATESARAECLAVVAEIEALPGSTHFTSPVDWRGLGLFDYPEVVTRPMDLATIRTSLEEQDSATAVGAAVLEFGDSMHLIFDNITLYHGRPQGDKTVFHSAREVRAVFDFKYRDRVESKVSRVEEARRALSEARGDAMGTAAAQSSLVAAPSKGKRVAIVAAHEDTSAMLPPFSPVTADVVADAAPPTARAGSPAGDATRSSSRGRSRRSGTVAAERPIDELLNLPLAPCLEALGLGAFEVGFAAEGFATGKDLAGLREEDVDAEVSPGLSLGMGHSIRLKRFLREAKEAQAKQGSAPVMSTAAEVSTMLISKGPSPPPELSPAPNTCEALEGRVEKRIRVVEAEIEALESQVSLL